MQTSGGDSVGNAKARVGMLIPSSNRLAEPQFYAYMPPRIGVHTARIQMTGKHRKGLQQLLPEVAKSSQALADAKCDVIVFHCTSNSMEHGPEGERAILETISKNSSAISVSTAQAILSALRVSNMQKITLVSPYNQATNDHEKHYLKEFGIEVVSDVALNLPVSDGFISVTPDDWHRTVMNNARDDIDGYFLSCANATHIEAIERLEADLGKRVVCSNQATIWWCAKKMKQKIEGVEWKRPMGRLIELDPD